MRTTILSGDRMPKEIEDEAKKLTEKYSAITIDYLKNSTAFSSPAMRATIVTNALMQNLCSLTCTMFYRDNDNIVHFEQELDNICGAIKKQCMMAYRGRIERDLRGEECTCCRDDCDCGCMESCPVHKKSLPTENKNEEHKDSDKQ